MERHSTPALHPSEDAARTGRGRGRAARSHRAEATREKILDAAAELFVEHGYLDTTMSAIAAAAGVAVQTLYLSIGGKVAVLEAALAAAAAGFARSEQVSWADAVRAESDGPRALAWHVAGAAAAVERGYPLAAVLRAAAADPEPAELLARSRADAMAVHARAVDELAEKPGFTTRISLLRATEILATLCSSEGYGLLVIGHGWTTQDWQDFVLRHVTADLFD